MKTCRQAELSQAAIGIAFLALAIALWAYAFRGLIEYDPSISLYPSASTDAEDLLFSPSGSSPRFIFPITLWMLFNRRVAILQAFGAPTESWWPASLLLLSSVLCVWAHLVSAFDLLIPSLILLLLGSAGLLGGRKLLSVVLAPSLFLILLLQRPGILMNQVVFDLQIFTADSTIWVLNLLGKNPQQFTDLIMMPNRIFQVIETCSGVRMMETLIMSTWLYLELFYRNRIQLILLILITPLVAMAFNTLRVVTIVLNPLSEVVGVHTTQGIVVLVLGILTIAGIDHVLDLAVSRRQRKGAPGEARSRRKESRSITRTPRIRLSVLFAVLVATAVATAIAPQYDMPKRDLKPLFTMPSQLDGWRASSLSLDKQFMGSVLFAEWVHRRYSKGDASVDVFVGSDHWQERRTSIASLKTALLYPGVVIEERGVLEFEQDELSTEYFVMRDRSGKHLVYRWHVGVDSLFDEAARSFLALEQSPFRRPGRALVVRLSTPIDGSPVGRVAAREQLDHFLPSLLQALEKLGVRKGGNPAAAVDRDRDVRPPIQINPGIQGAGALSTPQSLFATDSYTRHLEGQVIEDEVYIRENVQHTIIF